MFAAGVLVELGLVGGGVVVVLGALWITSRRGPKPAAAASTPSAPQASAAAAALAEPMRFRSPDRRGVARAPVVRPVVVHRDPPGTAPAQRTFALDVGLGGALLAGPADLAIGDVLDLLLDLGEPVSGRARVVRETPDGLKGVAFEALQAPDRDRLERYVATASSQPA